MRVQFLPFLFQSRLMFLQNPVTFGDGFITQMPQPRVFLDLRQRHAHVFQPKDETHPFQIAHTVFAVAVGVSFGAQQPFLLVVAQRGGGQTRLRGKFLGLHQISLL
jgi:hypothetical protein